MTQKYLADVTLIYIELMCFKMKREGEMEK